MAEHIIIDVEAAFSEIELRNVPDSENLDDRPNGNARSDYVSSGAHTSDSHGETILPPRLFDSHGELDYQVLLTTNPTSSEFEDELSLEVLDSHALSQRAPASPKAKPPAAYRPNVCFRKIISPSPTQRHDWAMGFLFRLSEIRTVLGVPPPLTATATVERVTPTAALPPQTAVHRARTDRSRPPRRRDTLPSPNDRERAPQRPGSLSSQTTPPCRKWSYSLSSPLWSFVITDNTTPPRAGNDRARSPHRSGALSSPTTTPREGNRRVRSPRRTGALHSPTAHPHVRNGRTRAPLRPRPDSRRQPAHARSPAHRSPPHPPHASSNESMRYFRVQHQEPTKSPLHQEPP